MEPKETVQFIADRYKIDLNQPSPIKLNASRWHDLGHLLNDLDFREGVEVGVYRGRFTATLAKRAPKMHLTGVDFWEVYPGYKDYCETDLESEAFLDAQRRTKDYPNVTLLKGWSPNIADQFEDESLDYVFIDANHSYEYVVADIAAWSKKVRSGGIVMGHDYFVNKKLNFGVIEAVNGWTKTQHIGPLFIWTDNCPSWMYVKQ